jgi:hypothetical protein
MQLKIPFLAKSKFHFGVIWLLTLLFLILFVANTALYDFLSLEDHFIEYATAVTLAVCGLFLIAAAYKKINKNFWLKAALYAGGVIFLIGAMEEISWGQRIFGVDTPEYLLEINDQNELNFHNIDKKFFDLLVDRATIIFVFMGTFLILLRQKSILNIPAPELPLVCAFAITPFFIQYNNPSLDFFHLQYFALMALLYYSFKNRKFNDLQIVIMSIFISLLIPVVHIYFNDLFPEHNNSANEYREFLFGLCCMFYAVHIYYQMGKDSVATGPEPQS